MRSQKDKGGTRSTGSKTGNRRTRAIGYPVRYVITSSYMVLKYPELLKIRNHAVRLYPLRGIRSQVPLDFQSSGDLVDKLKILLRQGYTWDYTGEQAQAIQDADGDDKEIDFN